MRAAPFLAGVLAAAVPAGQALAHHAFQAEFDCNAPVRLKGAVTSVEWTNPHAVVHILGGEAGKLAQDWAIVGGTPNTLLRMGMSREMLAVGTEISVTGWQTKDKTCPPAEGKQTLTCRASGRSVTFADGKTVFVGASGVGMATAAAPQPSAPGGRPVVTTGTYLRSDGAKPDVCPTSDPFAGDSAAPPGLYKQTNPSAR